MLMKKLSRRSQMEIMGLVIIVILISLAMLFVIQFIMMKEAGGIKKTYTHTQLSANTLNALTKTTADSCKNQDLTQLLQDCAAYRSRGGLIVCDDGTGSCEYVESAIDKILNKTLDRWNKEYSFSADKAEIEMETENCKREMNNIEKQTKIYPIPVPGSGNMNLRLDICN